MIRKVHTDLSRARSALDGEPPDPEPRYVTPLAEAWFERIQQGDDWDKPTAFGTDWRVSDSGFCARSVGYDIFRRRIGQELAELDPDSEAGKAKQAEWDAAQPTNPLTIADAWRMNLGTMVHEHLQSLIETAFPGARVEVKVDLRPGLDGSGHADIVIDDPDTPGHLAPHPHRTVVELKTINGFGFKAAAVEFRGQPEGPRMAHKTQGAVMAAALEADLLVIGYLSLECVSVNQAERSNLTEIGRFAAEWSYTPEQFRPWAEQETKRVKTILNILDQGNLAPRHSPEMPAGARVQDPSTGFWTLIDTNKAGVDFIADSGNWWGCSYCKHQDRCIADGPS